MLDAANRHLRPLGQGHGRGQSGQTLFDPIRMTHEQRHPGTPARPRWQCHDNRTIARIDAQADPPGARIAAPLHSRASGRESNNLLFGGLGAPSRDW